MNTPDTAPAPADRAGATTAGERPPYHPLPLLLVQVDPATAEVLAPLCTAQNVAVTRVTTLPQAVAAIQAHSQTLVVMHVDRDSVGMAEQISALLQRAGSSRQAGLFIARDAETVDALAGRLAGYFDVLCAPVRPDLLRSKFMLFLHLIRQGDQISEYERRMRTEIDLAARVQSRFMTPSLPRQSHLILSRHHVTCAAIGGDLQDIFGLGRGRIGVYMADVAGHGTSAAMLSGLVKMSFESLKEHIDPGKLPVSELLDPGVFLTRTNAAYHEGLPLECFVTLVYAVLDPNLRSIRISNAGHPPPILYRGETGEVSLLQFPSGPALGPVRNAYFPVTTMQLRLGDKLLFYTDGLIEAVSEEGVEFGTDRLLKLVKVCGGTSADQLMETLVAELDRFRGSAPLSDDCSILVAHFV